MEQDAALKVVPSVLTPDEAASPVWLKLKKVMQAEIDYLRRQNDRDLDERKTARLRGRIVQLNAMLTWGDAQPMLVDDEKLFKD